MKVKFFGGPCDGAEIKVHKEIPKTLVFPEQDSWGLLDERAWLAGGESDVVYKLSAISGMGPTITESRFQYEPPTPKAR